MQQQRNKQSSREMGRDMNRHFSTEDTDMTNKHMRKHSASLAIREIQIKTTMRSDLTPVRMVKVNKTGNNKCWRGCGERGTLLPCWWECELVQPLWKTVWRFLKELKIDLPYDPAIALLGIYPPFASTWMELEGIMLSEVSQSEKDKQCMFSFIWGI